MFKKTDTVITENKEIAKHIFRLTLLCKEADLEHFVPGQFANLEIPGHDELLLKRPLSICTADAENKTVTLVYQVKGKGTEALAALEKGAGIETILPIGRGFNLKAGDKSVFLVGGGVGIAPLLSVTQKWPDRKYETFLGYKSSEYQYCVDDFEKVSRKVYVSTDDGTLGEQCLVTEILARRLKEAVPDVILVCGPVPMIAAVKEILMPLRIPSQVSVEQRMCCGFGACSVCVCGVDSGEGLEYKKVCIDGPVFDLYEVAL